MPQFVIPFRNYPTLIESQNYLRRAFPTLTFLDPATFALPLLVFSGDVGDVAPSPVLPRFGLLTWGLTERGGRIGVEVRSSKAFAYLQADLFYKGQAAGLRVAPEFYLGQYQPLIPLASGELPDQEAQDYPFYMGETALDAGTVELWGEDGTVLNTWELLNTIAVQELRQTPVGYQMVGEFRGTPPDIPLDKDTLDAIKREDPNPFFMVLPIGEIGVQSHNRQRPYTRNEVQMVVESVNNGGVTGFDAHIPDSARAGKQAPLRWLKATFEEGASKAWGKVYVEPQATALREAFKAAMKENKTANPSIWGDSYVKPDGEWAALDLRGIDVSLTQAPSVPTLATVPQVVSEHVNDKTKGEAAVEELDLLKQQIAELTTSKVTLEAQNGVFQAVAELVGTPLDGVKTRVQELLDTEKKYRDLLAETRQTRIAELVGSVLGQPLVDYVPSMVAELAIPAEEAEASITQRATELLATDRWQRMTKSTVSELAGGNVVTGGQEPPRKITEKEADEMGAQYVRKGA